MFKNVDVFYVKPNEFFNINNVSELKFYNPIFLYTYLKCYPVSDKWNGKLILDGDYPIYRISSGENIDTDKSIIQVLVMESDEY